MAGPRTLEQLIAELEARHARLEAQIAALRLPVQGRDHALLLQYVLLRSGDAAAQWANAQGWRLPSATGERKYRAPDVLALLQPGTAATLPAGLLTLAREVFGVNTVAVDRQFN